MTRCLLILLDFLLAIRFSPICFGHQWRLVEKLEIHYTPKHGSWLDIAEIELSVLARQCLHQRIGSFAELRSVLQSWEKQRNAEERTISWRFTTDDARIRLRRLYPTLEDEQ